MKENLADPAKNRAKRHRNKKNGAKRQRNKKNEAKRHTNKNTGPKRQRNKKKRFVIVFCLCLTIFDLIWVIYLVKKKQNKGKNINK